MTLNSNFWRGRRVLITGHTGFKGAWAWACLESMGAKVSGLALAPETEPNLARILRLSDHATSYFGDIRDKILVEKVIGQEQPEVVLHMSAQALVRRGYREPVATFDVNVMGTLTLLEALRHAKDLKACLVVTSDKVYENNDLGRRFVETDPLGGSDPYSASKAACEIATSSFARSFFADKQSGSRQIPIATARAGNVIGGGDWSEDRIIPDIWRAQRRGAEVELRYPEATRPWQHVLEPVVGYLHFLEALCGGATDRSLNFGPADEAPVTVREIVGQFQSAYGREKANGWRLAPGDHPKEARLLAIDARRATAVLGWRPRLPGQEAVTWTAQWYAAYDRGEDMRAFTLGQIHAYEGRRPD